MFNKKEYDKQYYQDNKEKRKVQMKQHKMANKEKIKENKKEYNKQYYQDNKEKRKVQIKRYKMANTEKIKENKKEYYKANKEKINEYRRENRDQIIDRVLLRKYGITLEERDRMILEQDNKCERCHLPFEGIGTEKYAPVVDHDHSYPKGDPNSVRAILHTKCNLMVGSHNDSIEELKLSIDYLKKTSKLALTND